MTPPTAPQEDLDAPLLTAEGIDVGVLEEGATELPPPITIRPHHPDDVSDEMNSEICSFQECCTRIANDCETIFSARNVMLAWMCILTLAYTVFLILVLCEVLPEPFDVVCALAIGVTLILGLGMDLFWRWYFEQRYGLIIKSTIVAALALFLLKFSFAP
jgi:hypothetical protein